MEHTWDVKAAFITYQGKTTGKVRILHRDGQLRAFNATGIALNIKSEKPTRKRGHIRVWVAVTEHGEITIEEKCWTCGGWWRIASESAESLWHKGSREGLPGVRP